MTSINVTVCEVQAKAVKTGKLTVGMVGVPVSFSFDATWEGLKRIAVFRCGEMVRDRSLLLSDSTTVPYEVLYKENERLWVGVEGRGENGELVIPTTWAEVGVVLSGANATGRDGEEATPNAYDDIMEAIKNGALRGPQGIKGDTPVKGVDYHTVEDREALVDEVISIVKPKPRDMNVGKLTGAEMVQITGLKSADWQQATVVEDDLHEFATWAYGNADIDVSIYMSSVADTFAAMFDTVNPAENGYLHQLRGRTEVNKYKLAMLVPDSYGGDESMQAHGYSYKLTKGAYRVGDIFCGRFTQTRENGFVVKRNLMALWVGTRFLAFTGYDTAYVGEAADLAYEEIENYINGIMQGWVAEYYFVLRPQNIAVEDVISLKNDLQRDGAGKGFTDSAIHITEKGELICVKDASGNPLDGLTVYGKTVRHGENDAALVSTGGDGSIEVTLCGKNLFDFHKGVSLISFTTSEGALAEKYGYDIHLPAGTYTMKAYGTHTTSYIYGLVTDGNGNTKKSCSLVAGTSYMKQTVTIEDGDIIKIYNGVSISTTTISGSNLMFSRFDIQIEEGSTATAYEPYVGSRMYVSTTDGLAGIPVADDGNYTDGNGQAWICDELDFAKGVRITRIGRIADYAGEQIPGAYLSSTGALTNGATVFYALSEPVERKLTEGQLDGYLLLHTFKPFTSAYTECSAGLSLRYVADTKAYIDHKLAMLSGE